MYGREVLLAQLVPKLAVPLQDRWETERAILDASKQPAEDQTDEALVGAELERLSAADIVLVPYPVLSREVLRAWPCKRLSHINTR